MQEALKAQGKDLNGMSVSISGAGNVAIYAAEKVQQLGGRVMTLSDSIGFIYDPDGIKLDTVKLLKEVKRQRIREYSAIHKKARYMDGCRGIWGVACDVALPCATQNELDENSAGILIENGCIAVGEGANMPTTPEAMQLFHTHKTLFLPGKAANAGGVAVSGLEMAQNSQRLSWTFKEADNKLKTIMMKIYHDAEQAAEQYGCPGNFVLGANIAGFVKVADTMLAQGIV
jgi:glutamate dehydrogenase (NADP+)